LKISIIIPTFNEALNIAVCLRRTQAANPDAEIIVVDGGSDATELIVNEIIKELPLIRYIPNRPDRGKGHAIQVGIAASKGDIIAQLDADLQFHPEELHLLFAPILNNNADFVMGTRFLKQSTRNQGSTPPLRSFGNTVISALASVLFFKKMSDVLAGIKAWKKEVTESFKLKSDSYSYEVELPIKALNKGWRICEVPITTEPRTRGESSVKVFQVGLRLILDIVTWRVRSLFGTL
jgi:dolichol-phosphate mannosyltransferase